MLASSDGISSWTFLKPQHSNLNSNPLANQLWSIDFLTPPTPLIILHSLSAFFESLMPLKNWCLTHARWSKSILKHSIRFSGIFSKFKTILLHIVLLKCPHVQIAFLKFTCCDNSVYSNSCSSCSFEAEIIKIGLSSQKMYKNNILNFQVSTILLNACTKKKIWKPIEGTTYILCGRIRTKKPDRFMQMINNKHVRGLNKVNINPKQGPKCYRFKVNSITSALAILKSTLVKIHNHVCLKIKFAHSYRIQVLGFFLFRILLH